MATNFIFHCFRCKETITDNQPRCHELVEGVYQYRHWTCPKDQVRPEWTDEEAWEEYEVFINELRGNKEL